LIVLVLVLEHHGKKFENEDEDEDETSLRLPFHVRHPRMLQLLVAKLRQAGH